MTNEVDDILKYEENTASEGEVYGKVYLATVPVQGARVKVKNGTEEVLTDALGNYRINAEIGDVIEARILDNFNQVQVIQPERTDIELQPEGEILKEVLLKAEAKQIEEIETPYGTRKADALGFNIDEVTADEISSSYQNLDQIVARLPGVLIEGIGADKRYLFPRTMNSSFEIEAEPIIVIDNIIYEQRDGLDNLPPIDLQRIKSVQAIKGLAGTNRFGSLGAYGAIVIKTDLTDKKEGDEVKKPSALAENNEYAEELPMFDTLKNEKVSPWESIKKSNSFEEAKTTYLKLRENHQKSFEFYLDMADYFMQWNRNYALDILSNLALISMNNSRGLKILAFKYEELGAFEDAHTIYKRILKLEKNSAQAYRNLAQSYLNIKNHQKAFDMYVAMLSEDVVEADFSGMMGTITAEFQQMIKHYGDLFDLRNIPESLKDPAFKRDIRIVMEWTDANMEFDLQFVDPDRKFFKWKHNKLDTKDRMISEVTKGFSSESFDIDDSEEGLWLINLERLDSEQEMIPNYIKYTIYRNYGLPNERKLTKLIKWSDLNQKVTIDKFQFPVVR